MSNPPSHLKSMLCNIVFNVEVHIEATLNRFSLLNYIQSVNSRNLRVSLAMRRKTYESYPFKYFTTGKSMMTSRLERNDTNFITYTQVSYKLLAI